MTPKSLEKNIFKEQFSPSFKLIFSQLATGGL